MDDKRLLGYSTDVTEVEKHKPIFLNTAIVDKIFKIHNFTVSAPLMYPKYF